jgi:uncharacterized protein with PQ loop repeat
MAIALSLISIPIVIIALGAFFLWFIYGVVCPVGSLEI